MATNKIYLTPGTATVFKASGGDVALTFTSLANGAGHVSAQWDRGAGSLPGRYTFSLTLKAAAALAVGASFELYVGDTDVSANVPGNLGASDAAVASADKRRNLRPFAAIDADSTTNGELQVISGTVWIYGRYVSILAWNALGQALTATAGDHVLTLTPKPDDIAAAA